MSPLRWPQHIRRWSLGAVVLSLWVGLNWPVPKSGPVAAIPNGTHSQTVLSWLLGQLASPVPAQDAQGPFVLDPTTPTVFNGDLRDLPQDKPALLPERAEPERLFEEIIEGAKPLRVPDPVVQR